MTELILRINATKDARPNNLVVHPDGGTPATNNRFEPTGSDKPKTTDKDMSYVSGLGLKFALFAAQLEVLLGRDVFQLYPQIRPNGNDDVGCYENQQRAQPGSLCRLRDDVVFTLVEINRSKSINIGTCSRSD